MNSTTLKIVLKYVERFKLHHILFWAFYHFAWWTIFSGSLSEVFESIATPHGVVKYSGYVLYQALGVYFCLYVLIPKYLEKGRFMDFFLLIAASIFLMSVCITANYYLSAMVSGQSVYDLYNVSPKSPVTIFRHNALPSCVGAMTLGMSIKLTKNWVESQRKRQTLEKEKLETELKFLKSQFNPHFLFNTINSIFVLIDKNPEMASESLVKFSSLMRYQLYECNSNQIPLQLELAYIESFIELESLRQNENFELQVSLPKMKVQEPTIAPFILIPFIENAFKHLSEDRSLKKWVSLTIDVHGEQLYFELSNSANFELKHQLPQGVSYGGLGLANVKRRLDLIYPDSHSLLLKKGKDVHTVKLEVNLENNRVTSLKRMSV